MINKNKKSFIIICLIHKVIAKNYLLNYLYILLIHRNIHDNKFI